MKFFDRENEIARLREIRDKSLEVARFTVVTGRRRVGKTQLLKRAFEDGEYLYFYVARKTEKDLCSGFSQQVLDVLGLPLQIDRFEILFKALVELSKKRPLTIVIDEFQELYRVNDSIFSSMADIWDDGMKEAKLNLVVCGSVNRLMTKIFKDSSEPLYGRNTGLMHIDPFRVSVLKDILSTYSPRFKPDDLLALWTLTGGVARYVELLMDEKCLNRKTMIGFVFSADSPFFDEGMSILVQEFGKEYGTYFSILSSIASGHTEYSQIKNDVGAEVGSFLSKLETDYGLIKRKIPLLAAPRQKQASYEIDDCFFRFWFRFIWKNAYLKELQRFDVLRDIAARDFDMFSGYALERYFQWKFLEEARYTKMESWWDRKGENEIDLVCEDQTRNRLDFYEIKRDSSRIDLNVLKTKSEVFFAKHPELRSREVAHIGLSLEDM